MRWFLFRSVEVVALPENFVVCTDFVMGSLSYCQDTYIRKTVLFVPCYTNINKVGLKG